MRIVEIVRLSTEEQMGAGRVGLLRQKEENLNTIKRNNLILDHSIELIDVSGTSVLKTPEINNLINLMKSKFINGVVVADLDRLMRLDDFRDLAFLQEFIDNNILIYLPDNIIDLNTQSGFLLGGIQSIISGNELTQIKKRMINAKEIKRKQGKHPNNDLSLPLGISYDRKDEKYYYNDDSESVKNIFDLFYYKSIHNYMELERLTGIKHRTISNLLQNKIFIGIREYKFKRSKIKNVRENGRQGDKKKILREHHDVISNIVLSPPLIETEIFDNIQEIIKNNNREYHSKRNQEQCKFQYLSALTCGICGEKIYTMTGQNDNRDYYCCKSKKKGRNDKCNSNFLRKNVVDFNISHFLSNAFSSISSIRNIVSYNSKSENKSYQDQLANLEKQLQKLNLQREKLLDLYLDNIYQKDELAQKNNILEQEIQSIKHEIKSVNNNIIATDPTFLTHCLKDLSKVLSNYNLLNMIEKKGLVRECFKEFVLIKRGIISFTVNVCFLCTRLGVGNDRVNLYNQLHTFKFYLPEPYLEKEQPLAPVFNEIGLPIRQQYYSSKEISSVLNIQEETFRARVRSLKYPKPNNRHGLHWQFSLSEVKTIIELTAKLKTQGVVIK